MSSEYWLSIKGLNEYGVCIEDDSIRITPDQAEMLEKIGLSEIVRMLVGD